MFSSPLSWAFTAVFVLTGVYSLVRLAELSSGIDRTGSRVAELSHLLMSIAMVAMSWAWTGGPSTPGGVLQIVVFGLFGVWFLVRLLPGAHGHSRLGEGYHVVMDAAMVWMVAAMPQIMGGTGGAAHHGQGSDDMAGMPGMGAMPATGARSGAAGTPAWITVVSWLFIALLLAAAALWVARAARPDAATTVAPDTGAGDAEGVLTVAAPTQRVRSTGPRLDAGCHLLMSLGMAGMLLAML